METNFITIFTTGLFVGGLTCLAVQGGLLASALAKQEEARMKNSSTVLPVLSFLIAKLVAYTLFGGVLGWFGSLVSISVQAQVVLQLAVVIFMLGTALNLLNVHPIFRYFVIQPPRFLTRLLRKQSKSRSVFAPVLLGVFTVFIPCGTTQAMMALAIASGNPFLGALIMFVFILGTSPLFFALGFLTMKLGDVLHQKFMKVAALTIILLAFFNLDATISLSGSHYTIKNMLGKAFCAISYCGSSAAPLAAVSEQLITITDNGYSPNRFAVKAGSNVKIRLENNGSFGCAQAFTIPALNIQKVVGPNQKGSIVFKVPEKPGRLVFTCSMGMYPGIIEIIQ